MTISVYRSESGTQRAPGHEWVRWLDVRLPVTIEEGQSALDLIATKIAGLESFASDVPERAAGAEYALRKWSERLAEIEWAMERLRAGEPAASLELARERAAHAETMHRLDAMRVEVSALRARAGKAQKEQEGRGVVDGLREQVAVLNTAIKNRDATIERLRAPAGEMPLLGGGPNPRAVGREHELSAQVLDALDDMIAAGATHTKMSRYTAFKLNAQLPRGYRTIWREMHLARVAEAAEAFVDMSAEGGR